ncbi:MAG: D-alanine--D-alanine ligase [Parasulfuritortus sp.]|nr:D-alanine--D-alanine ligase [Parasulfuritortus sp.]
MLDFGKVGVMLGGRSAEREISLLSGNAVLAALREKGVDAHAFDPAERDLAELKAEGFDRIFLILHGRGGEDGTMQGLLELLGIPYTGSGVMASALGMDKWRTKLIWQAAGIPTAPFVMLDENTDFDAVVAKLGLPLFVKPATEGSSIGITKVKKAEDLPAAYRAAAEYDKLVLCESFVSGREVQFPVLGDQVLPSIRVETPCEFYDYQAKYFRDDTVYHCPGLPADEEATLDKTVLHAFRVLGCSGWGRVDVILADDGTPCFLEVNTAPGMTSHSLVPMSARTLGIDFPDLCLRVLELAHVG